jgi:hypothetical protein
MAAPQTQPISNYLGLLDPTDTKLNDTLLGMLNYDLPPARVFALKYKVFPCTMTTNLHNLHQGQSTGGIHATR